MEGELRLEWTGIMLRAESITDLRRKPSEAADHAAEACSPRAMLEVPLILPYPLKVLVTTCTQKLGNAFESLFASVCSCAHTGAAAASSSSSSPDVPRGGAIKAQREARMVKLIAAKLGPEVCLRDGAPAPDAGVLAWRAFAKWARQPTAEEAAMKRALARRPSRTPRNSPVDLSQRRDNELKTPNYHRVLFKKHQLYSKYLPEFTMLTLEELEALGPIPAWEAPIGEWRDWASLVRTSLDAWVGEESLFRMRAGEAEYGASYAPSS